MRTHSQLRELIRNPNLPKFHLLLIGVGLNAATTALMQGLCSSKVCTYIPCGSDYNMVKAAVAKVRRFFRADYSRIAAAALQPRCLYRTPLLCVV